MMNDRSVIEMGAGIVRRRGGLVLALMIVTVGLGPVRVTAEPIDPDNPPQGLFSDEWLAIRLAGQRAGYAHTTLSRDGDRITSRSVTVVSMSRGQAQIRIDAMESSTETVSGQPISFESVQKMSAMTTTVRGEVRDGRVYIEKSQFGMTQKMELAYPPGALMGWGLFAEQLRRGLAEGLTYEVQAYIPSLQLEGAVTARVEVGGKEEIELLDGKVEAVRMKTTMVSSTGTLEMVGWVDADGNVLKSQIAMMGITFEMIRTDKATATAQLEAPEIFFDTLIQSDRKIDRHLAKSLQFRLSTLGEGGALPKFPTTGMQKVLAESDSVVQLQVTRQDHQALKRGAKKQDKKPAGDGFAQYLESNLWINSDDPQVRTMAQAAVGRADNPYAVADELRRYVGRVIEDKNLNVGFASASEVCRNRQGDCSEHAVLLAALGRVHQLPSRVVVGLVYVPRFVGRSDVFGFHMWTQFYLAGQWVDFDAAQNESDCNPTHIAVVTSSLRDAALGEMAFSLIHIIGRLKIEVIEADPPEALSNVAPVSNR